MHVSMPSKGFVTNLAEDGPEPPPFLAQTSRSPDDQRPACWHIASPVFSRAPREFYFYLFILFIRKKKGRTFHMLRCYRLVKFLDPAPLRLCSVCASEPGLGNAPCSFFLDDHASGATRQNHLSSPTPCTSSLPRRGIAARSPPPVVKSYFVRTLQKPGGDASRLTDLGCNQEHDSEGQF